MAVSLHLYYPDKINAQVSFPSKWNDLREPELHFVANILLNQSKENAPESSPLILRYILEQRLKSVNPKVANIPDLLPP